MPGCSDLAGDPRFLKFCIRLPEPGLRLIDLCRAGEAVNGVEKTVWPHFRQTVTGQKMWR